VDALARRGQVVLERAVRALAGRLQIALDPLAGAAQRQHLPPQLLGLGQAEFGVLDVDGQALDPAVAHGGPESGIELGDAPGLDLLTEGQARLFLLQHRAVHAPDQDRVAGRALLSSPSPGENAG